MKKIILIFLIFFVSSVSHAEIITGLVVSIADGDTITILENKKQHKIRLYGIDTPEKRQDFGQKAKQFTSNMVYKKHVKVVSKATDIYGRTVGMVYIGNKCLNEELVRHGYAWVYQKYCKDALCQKWLDYERIARTNNKGLWNGNQVAPWDYRKGKRDSKTINKQTEAGIFHGNTSSHVFHKSSCRYFNCKNCTAIFNSRSEAIKAGFKPCGMCKP